MLLTLCTSYYLFSCTCAGKCVLYITSVNTAFFVIVLQLALCCYTSALINDKLNYYYNYYYYYYYHHHHLKFSKQYFKNQFYFPHKVMKNTKEFHCWTPQHRHTVFRLQTSVLQCAVNFTHSIPFKSHLTQKSNSLFTCILWILGQILTKPHAWNCYNYRSISM